MKEALVFESNDIKKLIAEKFGVPEKNVIQSKYSFTVILEDKEEPEEE